MVAPRSLITAAMDMEPLYQGTMTSLCGLYASINALLISSALTQPLSHHTLRKLFKHGIATLESEGILGEVITRGMEPSTWVWLNAALIKHANELTRHTFRCKFIMRRCQRSNTQGMLKIIERATSHGRPVLLCLLGAYNHYTVATGIKHDRIILFDSANYQWVSTFSVELEHRKATARHRILGKIAACVERI